MGYIYVITNLINSKKYVGKTTTTTGKRAHTHVAACCIGNMKTAFGYIWKYLPEPI